MEYLIQLMHSVPADSNQMLVAPISDVGEVRHAGLAVLTSSSVSQKASCVLSLIAHTGRSVISDLVGGHKLVSKHCWNVPFVAPSETEDGAPEHANVPDDNEQRKRLTSSQPILHHFFHAHFFCSSLPLRRLCSTVSLFA